MTKFKPWFVVPWQSWTCKIDNCGDTFSNPVELLHHVDLKHRPGFLRDLKKMTNDRRTNVTARYWDPKITKWDDILEKAIEYRKQWRETWNE